jgi:CheY-like chemotaxis protein
MLLRRAPTPLRDVLRNAVDTAQPLFNQCGHELVLTLPEQDIVLDADPVRLAQVFANLLNNAAKYSEPGRRVELRAELRHEPALAAPLQVAVQVIDQGIGLDTEHLETVFDLFRQIDTRVERAHGGHVSVHSDGPGQGCIFTVLLPCTERAAAALPEPPPSVPATVGEAAHPLRVLVVDDNRDAADTLAAMVRLLGHEAEALYDPQMVEAAVGRLTPDLIFLDLGMPGRSGFDVARSLRAQPNGGGMKLVAVTGWGQAEDRRRSLDAGFDQHLVKPPDLETVKQLCTSRPSQGRPDRQAEVE